MLRVEEINLLMEALYGTLREKIPKLRAPIIGKVEGVRSVGVYGPLAFQFLLTGGITGQITLIMEWETALKLASKILKYQKLESFNEEAQLALEERIKIALEKITQKLSSDHGPTEMFLLPTLTDSNILLSVYPHTEVVRIEIQTLWEPIGLYLAFPKEQVHAA